MSRPAQQRNRLPVLVILSGAMLWGLVWLPLKHFHQLGIAGAPLVFCTYGIAGLVTLPWLLRGHRDWRGHSGSLLLILLLGGYTNLSFPLAMIHGQVVRVIMLFYLAPVWAVLAGRVILKEPITPMRWVGVLLALVGAFLLLGGPAVLQGAINSVDSLALSAGLAFALTNVTCRAVQWVSVTIKTYSMFLGSGVLSGIVVLVQGQSLPAVSWLQGGELAAFGLGWLLVAGMATVYGVTHLEAGRAAILLMLELVVAVFSAILIGNESLSVKEALGGGLIVFAALLETRSGRQGKRSKRKR